VRCTGYWNERNELIPAFDESQDGRGAHGGFVPADRRVNAFSYRVPRHSGRSLEQSTFVSFVRRCARHRGAGDAWRSVGLVRRWGPTLVDKQNRTC